jgi:hypothetical protein
MVERNTIAAGKPSVIAAAHVPFFAADGDFAAFQVTGFASGKLSASYALGNAVLLKFAALVDGGGMAGRRHRSSLAKPDRRAKCEKSDAKQRSFHGHILLRGGGLSRLSADPRSHP